MDSALTYAWQKAEAQMGTFREAMKLRSERNNFLSAFSNEVGKAFAEAEPNRRTGKTIRAALKAALMMSEGKNVVVYYGEGTSNTPQTARMFLSRVRQVLSTMGCLETNKNGPMGAECVGGGTITARRKLLDADYIMVDI